MQIKLDIALAKVLTEEMKHADVKSQLQDIQQSSQSRLASLQSKIKTFQDREGEWVEEGEYLFKIEVKDGKKVKITITL